MLNWFGQGWWEDLMEWWYFTGECDPPEESESNDSTIEEEGKDG